MSLNVHISRKNQTGQDLWSDYTQPIEQKSGYLIVGSDFHSDKMKKNFEAEKKTNEL